MGEVIKLQTHSTSLTHSTYVEAQEELVNLRPAVVAEIHVLRERASAAEDVYPALQEIHSILALALPLLQEAEKKLTEAIDSLDDEDPISADDALQSVQASLPELFCCRSLGDGFGTVISAIFHGLKNLNGVIVTRTQITVLKKIFSALRARPFLPYDEALALTIELETAGMKVDAQGLEIIGGLLLAKGVSSVS